MKELRNERIKKNDALIYRSVNVLIFKTAHRHIITLSNQHISISVEAAARCFGRNWTRNPASEGYLNQ